MERVDASTEAVPQLSIRTFYYPAADSSPGATALVVEITALTDSYMIWAGCCEELPVENNNALPDRKERPSILEDAAENTPSAPGYSPSTLNVVDPRVLAVARQGRIAQDWACAMPSMNVSLAATPGVPCI